MKVATYLNLLTTNVPYILKQVNWFVLQINWLVSIWWATLVVNGLLSSEQLGVSSRNSDTLKSEHLHMRKLPFILSRLHFTNQVLIRQNNLSFFQLYEMAWHWNLHCGQPSAIENNWCRRQLAHTVFQKLVSGLQITHELHERLVASSVVFNMVLSSWIFNFMP